MIKHSKYFILLPLFFFGCNTTKKVRNYLTNSPWVVSEVTYKNENYGLFFFNSNMMTFYNDGTCKMPDFDFDFRTTEWSLLKVKQDTFYIEIYNSDQNFLDGTYKGVFDFSNQSVLHMKLETDSIVLYCDAERIR